MLIAGPSNLLSGVEAADFSVGATSVSIDTTGCLMGAGDGYKITLEVARVPVSATIFGLLGGPLGLARQRRRRRKF